MQIIRLIFFFFFFSFFLYSDGEDAGFAYLQKLRAKANMVPFIRNSLLDKSSSNHSNYLKINNTGGHIENASKSGFTGKTPGDRAKSVGLFSKTVGENVSTGQAGFKESIDDLFTAIYHRLGFINVEFDMVGLGKVDNKYSYLMSNSLIEALCKDAPSENSGYKLCANDKAFGTDKVNGLKKQTADKSSKVIIWPPDNSDDNPPYFYDEHPDPLPNHEVSGNPISILFNKYTYSTPPTINSFKLLDSDGKVVKTISRNKSNAINDGFLSEYVHILFPDERLKWGSTYKIEYDFSSTIGAIKGTSTFKTRELTSKVYYVTQKDVELRVIANQEYTIDLVPLDAQDNILAKGYGGGGTADAQGFTLISLNTFKVTLKGSIGGYIDYKFGGGLRSVKLVISDSDDVGNDADDSGTQIDISYTKGWNLNSLLDKTAISDKSSYFKNFSVLYTYNGTKFIFNPSSIDYKEAYFVYYENATTNKVPFKVNETYEISVDTIKKDSWSLVPIGQDINSVSDYFSTDMLYILKNSRYEKPSGGLKRGQAIWVFKK